ncbi:hypothetical protein SAMN05216563_1077 [Phytobacter palmae]|nr:hypothetical protein SAMN05216563_1077 [Phytobacter palmae]
MPLNTRQAGTATPRDKAWKLADGRGLYLMVNTNGSKYWHMKYRFAGKRKTLILSLPGHFTCGGFW